MSAYPFYPIEHPIKSAKYLAGAVAVSLVMEKIHHTVRDWLAPEPAPAPDKREVSELTQPIEPVRVEHDR
jgi:hypothetical protein